MTATSILQMVGGATNFTMGAYQFVKGQKQLKGIRDIAYEIPEEYALNQQITEQLAYEGLGSQARNQVNSRVAQNQAEMMYSSGDLGAALEMSSAAIIASNNAIAEFNTRDAMARITGNQLRMQANQAMADAKDTEYLEKKQEIDRRRTEANALIGAGLQNMVSGLDMGGGASTMMNSDISGEGKKKKKKKENESIYEDSFLDSYDDTEDFTS